jgi:DNA polymerase/3'-5' exonuclease PolX
MTLLEAQRIAEQSALLIEPYCVKVQIAGSVRRRRPQCNDVDLVAIPRLKAHRNLLGDIELTENLLHTALIRYVQENRGKIFWASGAEPKPDGVNFLLQGTKCQLDIFIATPATFATRLITRTGSKEHNVWISNRAATLHGHFKPQEGIWLPKPGLIQPESEEAFYQALGLPFIEPEHREAMDLMRLETELA